jgi:hypothetical protein
MGWSCLWPWPLLVWWWNRDLELYRGGVLVWRPVNGSLYWLYSLMGFFCLGLWPWPWQVCCLGDDLDLQLLSLNLDLPYAAETGRWCGHWGCESCCVRQWLWLASRMCSSEQAIAKICYKKLE